MEYCLSQDYGGFAAMDTAENIEGIGSKKRRRKTAKGSRMDESYG